MKRLFIGIELSEEARAGVVAVQDRLRDAATRQGVRFVRSEKIHLTLVFLGSLPEEALGALDAACRPVGERHLSLSLAASGVGGFPDLRRPKVLWIRTSGDIERLNALQADLAIAVSAHAEIEKRDYSPHLTLARISPGSKEVGRIAAGIAQEIGDEKVANWEVREVVLFESAPDGQYLPLLRWPLA